MAVKSYKVGPGTLTLGDGATLITVSDQVRSLLVRGTERVTRTEPVPVLSGDELPADESTSYEYVMVGTFLQDIDVDGINDWSWTHKGTEQPFRYVPNTAADRVITGVVIPAPLDTGGDVDKTKRPEAGFTWRCPTEPTRGDATP